MSPSVSVALEHARQQWKQGHRRLQADGGDARRRARLDAQVEAVTEELRRRLGTTFTLRELLAFYDAADTWARDAVAERLPGTDWLRDQALVEDAAFYLYARGAVDYEP